MSTLLLRLAGPLQSWGSSSKFNIRMTNREPTKSGVIGLIAAAFGLRRDDEIYDLQQKLKFGVRIDQEGSIIIDYHISSWGSRPVEENNGDPLPPTYRHYLADALFLVGLEGDDKLLQEIDAAVQNPVFPLYLGRRSCPPVGPFSLGIREGQSLLEALKEEPWQAGEWYKNQAPPELSLEIVHDAGIHDVGAYTLRDIPVSFSQTHRKYNFRSVMNNYQRLPNPASRYARNHEISTEHDPIACIDSVKQGGE